MSLYVTLTHHLLQDGSNLAATQRAYHPDEVLKNDSLTVDVKYYLAHQVHPVVARLCDPIDGTDTAHIAECLGDCTLLIVVSLPLVVCPANVYIFVRVYKYI